MNNNEIPDLDAGGLRSFGITTGAIFAGLFGLLFPYLLGRPFPIWPWGVFLVLGIWALLAPASLGPVYRGWMRIGLLLGKVTTPIIMTLLFVVAIFPMSILLRIFGKDPMKSGFDQSDTYRENSKTPSISNMEKPY